MGYLVRDLLVLTIKGLLYVFGAAFYIIVYLAKAPMYIKRAWRWYKADQNSDNRTMKRR
ncbi:hypothetical protein ACOALA_04030 [Alicyclobacillus acidoterrestris]|uniref:hypothetical protein n=1 Tax=Alicyclobacillus acidoterrestris TaxID=1450 RepID=UPI003F52BB28